MRFLVEFGRTPVVTIFSPLYQQETTTVGRNALEPQLN